MRRILIAAALACGLCVGLNARAADKKDKEIKGVVIDNACGAKQMSKANPEEAAEGHPKSCALKCAKGGDGFSLISGKKSYKLDTASNEKVTKYLSEDTNATKVVVMGTLSDDGKTLTVNEIKGASDKDKAEKKS
jgi:hypothetical protein